MTIDALTPVHPENAEAVNFQMFDTYVRVPSCIQY